MGDLVKSDNLIKWTLQTTSIAQSTQVSTIFTIQDKKLTFSFHSGYNTSDKDRQPISLSVIFNGNEKLIPPVDVIVRVSSTSKTFPLSRHTITGEYQQMIWSSFDYGIRGSLLTFEMIVQDTIGKGK